MKNYHDLLRTILAEGIRQSNRTGIDTLTLPGATLKFDLRDGFPAITTKKLAFNAVKGELIGFLRGYDNVKDFQALGCNVWNQNATADYWLNNPNNPNHTGVDGDLGRIYGKQWRNWNGTDISGARVVEVDQIARALDLVRNEPTNRRIVVSAWNPAELDQAALPPCHLLFQLLPHVETKTLHMTMYQRSCDMFLGVPFNIASYALLLELFAAWTGYTAGTLTMFLADAHIYENHIEQVREQLGREEYPLPKLSLAFQVPREDVSQAPLGLLLADLQPDDIELIGYQSHPAIKAPMAV